MRSNITRDGKMNRREPRAAHPPSSGLSCADCGTGAVKHPMRVDRHLKAAAKLCNGAAIFTPAEHLCHAGLVLLKRLRAHLVGPACGQSLSTCIEFLHCIGATCVNSTLMLPGVLPSKHARLYTNTRNAATNAMCRLEKPTRPLIYPTVSLMHLCLDSSCAPVYCRDVAVHLDGMMVAFLGSRRQQCVHVTKT